MNNKYHIIGAGLAGCVMAKHLDCIVYEKSLVGGLCRDTEYFQDFVHIFHANNDEVYKFLSENCDLREYHIKFLSYVNGEYKAWYPKEITQEVIDTQVVGYSQKMWNAPPPQEALARVRTSPDGYFFHDKYQFIPNFRQLWENLLKDKPVVYKRVFNGEIDGKIILTAPIDEYFDYCYGRLPYRGISSTHISSEIRLQADCINFPDTTLPFTRLVDYGRMGFKGGYIGIEMPCNDRHYPIRNEESVAIYEKYKALAESKGIILVGRLATFSYMDMDKVIEQCLNKIKEL
jgi:UDP-galactopyranose mutase